MNAINSINHFFSEIDCHFQCYNMGRLILPIDSQELIDFEQNNSAWQSPFVQCAWLAIVFWQQGTNIKQTDNAHYVWFLKLPLDEQAKLNLVARDDFLRRLFTALENYLTDAQQNKHQTAAAKLHSLETSMQDNPYGFQPKEEQMANFHAIVHKQLGLSASRYYPATQEYLRSPDNFAQWQPLSFQGIADFTARLDESCHEETNEQLIARHIALLPLSPFQVFAAGLENQLISQSLTQAIYDTLRQALEQPDNKHLELIAVCAAAVRASARSMDEELQIQLLTTVLNSSAGTDIEVLATIAGRCWRLIKHPELLSPFLEALANTTSVSQGQNYTSEQEKTQRQSAFNAILSDLMFIPGIRTHILAMFRSPERSVQLTQAIGAFLQQRF